MRALVYIFSLIAFCNSLMAQENTMKFDYTVSYIFGNKEKDTVNVGVGNTGKLLLVDSNAFDKEITNGMSRSILPKFDKPDVKMLVDLEKENFYILMQNKGKIIYSAGTLNDYFPTGIMGKDSTISPKYVSLKFVETERIKSVLDKNYKLYSVYSDLKEELPIYIAIEPKLEFDGSFIINKLTNSLFPSREGAIEYTNFKQGLILYAEDHTGMELFKAISIETSPIQITLQEPFIIKKQ